MPIHAVMPAQRLVPARVRVLLQALDQWPASAAAADAAAPARRRR
jgi:hypothetical protein